MTVEFAKLHGAGNDYIAVDGRGIDRDWGELSKEMSRLAFGVGSDGIVLVQDSDNLYALRWRHDATSVASGSREYSWQTSPIPGNET